MMDIWNSQFQVHGGVRKAAHSGRLAVRHPEGLCKDKRHHMTALGPTSTS